MVPGQPAERRAAAHCAQRTPGRHPGRQRHQARKKCAARWTKKLHATLEQRLGESFKLVSDRLEQAQGPGRNADPGGSVGDLKRVMTNVKTRGTWAKCSWAPSSTTCSRPTSSRATSRPCRAATSWWNLPSACQASATEQPVWLPIDPSTPWSTSACWMRKTGRQGGHPVGGQRVRKPPSSSRPRKSSPIRGAPHTTDFAVLYLPTEGLFAEVMRRPGLVEAVQNDCRVMITGPG